MTKKIIAVIALLAAGASGAFAQNSGTQVPNPADTEGSGLLGKRYAALGFVYQDINHSDIDIFGAGAAVNVPVTPNIDVSAVLTHSWVEAHSDINAEALEVSSTYYFKQGQFKPFGTVSLGYSWRDLGATSDDTGTWGVSGGVEYSLNATDSFDVSIGYDDDFNSGAGVWDGTIAANHWFTKAIAVRFSASLIEEGHRQFALAGIWRF